MLLITERMELLLSEYGVFGTHVIWEWKVSKAPHKQFRACNNRSVVINYSNELLCVNTMQLLLSWVRPCGVVIECHNPSPLLPSCVCDIVSSRGSSQEHIYTCGVYI